MDELWTFLLDALLFFVIFKLGQISAWNKMQTKNREIIQVGLEEITKTKKYPIITVEEINGVLYAFDGNDFLAQGNSADEVGRLIIQRFSDKYYLAKIEIKSQSMPPNHNNQ
jgi:hypothetical protein